MVCGRPTSALPWRPSASMRPPRCSMRASWPGTSVPGTTCAIAFGLGRGTILEDSALLRQAEREALESAEEFLVRVRSALHLETRRRTDRLFLDHQPAIARAMGFEDEPGLPAVDGLMRAVFDHARQVEHVSRSVFDRYLRGESDALPLDDTPAGVLRAFAEVATERGVMGASSLDRIEDMLIEEEVEWTDRKSTR